MNRFADTADRLDRFIADIKTRQCDATGAGPQPAPDRPSPGVHPDLEWQRSYATRTIRPRGRGESAPMLQSVVARPILRSQPPEPRPEPVRPAPAAGHIGAALGKPAKKRGVLARLFRGSDR